jgi:hypothetical protein
MTEMPSQRRLEYAHGITRTDLAYEETPEGLVIRMPRPRLRDLPPLVKLILAVGPILFLVGVCTGAGGVMMVPVAISNILIVSIVFLSIRRNMILEVRDGRLHAGFGPTDFGWSRAQNWPLENIKSITVMPEAGGLTLHLHREEMVDLTWGADRQVLEWVAVKLNEAIEHRRSA